MQNGIIWGNSPDNIYLEGAAPEIFYSDVQHGFEGNGNISENPLFNYGPLGDYYLSQIAAGNYVDSPCINTGGSHSNSICWDSSGGAVCLDSKTTRIDGGLDIDMVDMGYHYKPKEAEPVLGCRVFMPSRDFGPGDVCFCVVYILNPEDSAFEEIPVFVVLDVYGAFFFAPGFTDFDYYTENIPPGEKKLDVLPEFIWPEGAGSAEGVVWYAALTNPEKTELLGQMGTFSFSWHQ